LWSLLGEGRRFRRVPTLLLLILLPTLSLRTAEASGLSDYQKGNYPGALKDFENRLQFKQNPLYSSRGITPEKKRREEPKELTIKREPLANIVVIPSSEQQDKSEVDTTTQS